MIFQGGMPLKDIKTKPPGGKPKILEKAASMPKSAAKRAWIQAEQKAKTDLKKAPQGKEDQTEQTNNAPAIDASERMVGGTAQTIQKGGGAASSLLRFPQ